MKMQNNNEIKARVNAGALWLEEQFGPEWIDKINLDRLNLSSSTTCIAGQVYGNYSKLVRDKLAGDFVQAVDYGFGEAFDQLNEAWTKKILKLRKAKTQKSLKKRIRKILTVNEELDFAIVHLQNAQRHAAKLGMVCVEEPVAQALEAIRNSDAQSEVFTDLWREVAK
jgi:hypothetical protein